jgi:hypothetical protein
MATAAEGQLRLEIGAEDKGPALSPTADLVGAKLEATATIIERPWLLCGRRRPPA